MSGVRSRFVSGNHARVRDVRPCLPSRWEGWRLASIASGSRLFPASSSLASDQAEVPDSGMTSRAYVECIPEGTSSRHREILVHPEQRTSRLPCNGAGIGTQGIPGSAARDPCTPRYTYMLRALLAVLGRPWTIFTPSCTSHPISWTDGGWEESMYPCT